MLTTVGCYESTVPRFQLSNTFAASDPLVIDYQPFGGSLQAIRGDWNGDGIDTVGLYDPVTSKFYLGEAHEPFFFGEGNLGWQPIVGDWDADGVDTVGLYAPDTSVFFLRNEHDGGAADEMFAYGAGGLGWQPVAGDWNNDGIDTVGLYAPDTSVFFLRNEHDGGAADEMFAYGAGDLGWQPVAGDWNSDGVDTVGLYAPDTSVFFLRNEHDGGSADEMFAFGTGGLGWQFIAGDWNNDGTDTVGLYAPSASTFYLRDVHAGGNPDRVLAPDPVVGDWNGDGIDTIGLYRRLTRTFHLRNGNTTGAAEIELSFEGLPAGNYLPIAGDWDADGVETIGLYQPGLSCFYLRNSNSSGVAEITFAYGSPSEGYLPIAGDWDGDGFDTVGLYHPASVFFLRNALAGGAADIYFGWGVPHDNWRPLAGDWDGDGIDTVGLYALDGSMHLTNERETPVLDVFLTWGGGPDEGWLPLSGDWDGSSVKFADPDLRTAVHHALALPLDTRLTPDDMLQLTTLTVDSSLLRSLSGLQYAANLQSLILIPSDLSQPGDLSDLSPLAGLTQLNTAVLEGLGLSDSELDPLGNLISLTSLDLRHNEITATALPASLSNLTALESLDLRYNQIDVVPAAIANLPALASLSVYGNPLTDTPRTGLANLAGKLINIDLAPDHPDAAQSVGDLADALYNLPIEMYEYVVNTVEFQPYAGAMKGPLAVLQTKAGNDWDTPSLLAGLFGEAGITTRYVSGRVQAATEDVLNWVGAADGVGAQWILNNAGAPSAINEDGTEMQFDHRWLEAQFTAGGPWLRLDPSWKARQRRDELRNMLEEVAFDADPVGNDYFAATTKLLPHEFYEEEVRQYLAENDPGVSVADIACAGAILPQKIDVLPAALPYQVIGTPTVIGSSIPAGNTHRVRVTLKDASQNILFGPQVLVLPEMSLKRVTVQPVPYGVDQIKPQLLLDGVVVQSGTAVAKTSNVNLVLEHLNADGNSTVDRTLNFPRKADEYLGILLDANQVSHELVLDQRRIVNDAAVTKANGGTPAQDEQIGGLLHLAGLKYYYDSDHGEDVIAALTGGRRVQTFVGSGIASGKTTLQTLDAQLQGNLQIPYLPEELKIDLPNGNADAVSIFDTTEYDQSHTTSLDRRRFELAGYLGSAMEHAIWEELTNIATISTVKSLQIAREESIPVFAINSSNAATYMPQLTHSQSVKNAIQTEINAGSTVTVPRDPTPLGDWDGVGYVAANANYIGYIISGGLAGQTPSTFHGGYTTGFPQTVLPKTNPPEPQSPTHTYASDPIDVASGTVVHDETDFAFPGLGFPLAFARHYQSSHTGNLDFDGQGGADFNSDRGMGEGWSFTYSDRLDTSLDTRDPAGSKIWFTGGGDRLKFEPNGSGGYKTPDAMFGQLATNASGGYTWTDKTGSTVQFDGNGRLLRMQDRYGNGVAVSYYSDSPTSGQFRQIQYVRDLKYTTTRYLTFAYSGTHISSITDFTSPARVWSYQYDGNGRLWKALAPSDAQTPQAVVTYQYYTDARRSGLLQKVIAPNGGETTFTYYVNRRGFEVTDAEGMVHSLSYNLFRDRTEFADGHDELTYYTHNDKGNVVEEVYPDRSSVAYAWQEGLKKSITDAFGQTTTFDHDANGNVTQLTDRAGYVTTYTYTDYANVETITVAGEPGTTLDDQVTTYRYFTDGLGKDSSLKEVEDALGNISSYTYPASNRGLPDTMTRPKGAGDPTSAYETRYEYNAAGQVTLRRSRVEAGKWATESSQYYDHGGLEWTTTGYYTNDAGTPLSTGVSTNYTYNLLGRMLTETLPDPDQAGVGLPRPLTTSTYAAIGNLETVTDTVGRVSRFEYDDLQRPVKAVNSDGTYRTMQYDSAGRLVSETDELGRITRYGYDSRGRRIMTLRPDGSTVRTTYDGGNRVIAQTDARGFTTRLEYDKLGRKVAEILPDPDGDGPLGETVTRFGYDLYGNLQYVTDAMGAYLGDPEHSTEYVHDAIGRRTHVILADPDGAGAGAGRPTTQVTYDAHGNVLTSTDARGYVTTFAYDELDRKIRETTPDSDGGGPLGPLTTRWFYDTRGNVQYVVNPRGSDAKEAEYTTEFAYDNLGRKLREILPDPDGTSNPLARPEIAYAFDAMGNPTSVTDPRGNVTRYVHDGRNRRTHVTDALAAAAGDPAHSTITAYDAVGNAVLVTNALGHTTRYRYDGRNRLVEEMLPAPGPGAASPVIEYAYDPSGNLVSVSDALGHTTWQEYDGLNRPTAVTDALGSGPGDPLHTSRTRYDALGNVVTLTDALGRVTTFDHDNLGRRIKEIQPDPDGPGGESPPETGFAYDANGNLISVTDPRGYTTWHRYDALNRRTHVTDALGYYAGDPAHTTVTTYDALGNAVAVTDPLGRTTDYTFDHLNRLTSEILPEIERYDGQFARPTTTYGHDEAGNLISVTDALGYATRYRYDALNRRDCVTDALGSALGDPAHSVFTTYDAAGQIIAVTDQAGRATTYEFDALGRKTKEIQPDPDGEGPLPRPETSFAFDAAGNLVSVTDPLNQTTWYKYDELNRRTHVIDALGAGPEDLDHATVTVYDAVGNIRFLTDPEDNVSEFFYDGLDRLITETNAHGSRSHQYDPAGNLTQTMDRNGRVSRYVYDPVNRQVEERWLNGSQIVHTIHHWYDDAGQLVGVTETDDPNDTDDGDATLYQYSYDPAGNITRARMATGELTQGPIVIFGSALTPGDPVVDWDGDGVEERYRQPTTAWWHLGDLVLVKVNSTDFDPVLIIERPDGQPSHWLVDVDGAGEGNAWKLFVIDQEGGWKVKVTSRDMAVGNFTVEILTGPYPLVSEALAEFEYGYDELGNLKRATDNVNGVSEFVYDPLGQLSQVKQAVNDTVNKRADFTYYDDGQFDTITRYSNDGATTVATTNYSTYDGMGRLKAMSHSYGEATLNYTWSYDAASRITGMALPDDTISFALDATNQLTGATYIYQDDESYDYDDNGNRESANGVNYQPAGPGNQLLNDGTYAYTYDNEGNRLTRTHNTSGALTEYHPGVK